MNTLSDIKVVAIDADDTLWDCQSHFDRVESEYCRLLAAYGSAEHISEQLFRTEQANMELLGYGCKAFTLSLIQNAVAVSQGRVSGHDIGQILDMGVSLLNLPATPLPGVEPTLAALHADGRHVLALFTKGELLDQQNKLMRSRLSRYFAHVEIVSDKTERAFLRLCRRLRTAPARVLMVGNSLRSDAAPALATGAWAAHIPFHATWKMEHADAPDSPRLLQLNQFSDLLPLLGLPPLAADSATNQQYITQ